MADPSFPEGLRQPDQRSCGAACLVVAEGLVLEAGPDSLRVYEPAAGRVQRVPREVFVGRRLRLGGWDVPWWLVLSESPGRRTRA